MERTIKKAGFVVMVDAICGGPTILHKISSDEDSNIMHPEFYLTELDAWKEIAEDMIEVLQQFINGERELTDTDFSTDLYTAYCELYDDDSIIVTAGNNAAFQYETSIKEINS